MTASGSDDAVDAAGAAINILPGSSVNVIGSNNTITLTTGDTLGAYGGGNSITANPDNEVFLADTGASFDQVAVNGDQAGTATANGGTSGIYLDTSTAANLFGSGDGVALTGTGDVLGAYGGGNTINTGADDLLVAGDTGGNFDTIDATGDQTGGTVVSGQGTGIILNADAAANLFGSGNTTTLGGPGDVLGAYGGGNTINTGADDLLVAGNTGGDFDAINANGDQSGGTVVSGQGTGIILNADAAANLFGSGNTATLGGPGDVLGAYGGGNTISTGADDLLVAGDTAGDFDTIDANGDQSGGTAINGGGEQAFLKTRTPR